MSFNRPWTSLLVLALSFSRPAKTISERFNRPWTSLLVLAGSRAFVETGVNSFNRPWTSLLVLAEMAGDMDPEAVSVSIVLGRLSWYSLTPRNGTGGMSSHSVSIVLGRLSWYSRIIP